MIVSSFDPRTRTWARPFPQSLARHDVVYQSPPEDALQGLPVGSGDLGMLLWTEGSRLVAAVNKTDLFDDSPDAGDGTVEGVEYDHEPSLRHGARLAVDFGMPVFDILYLQRFEARLGLADATVRMESETPFLKVKATAFAGNPDHVIVLQCEAECGEDIAVRAVLERYGSRPYSYWYSGFNRDATIGLSGTRIEAAGNMILIRQELRSLHFVVGARFLGATGAAEADNRHSGSFTTRKGRSIAFTLLITAVTSENAADPRAAVEEILSRAAAKGFSALHEDHARDWEAFWKASFVSLPDDYLENIWYLNLYYANSSCRGAYPPRFTNGVWGWNRDVSNWVYYFHWNMQNFIWPLHTANHAELTEPYFTFRSRSLENARIYAKKRQGREGAFYADVVDRLGRAVGTRWYNLTPGAQIALLFWKHYRFTGDRRFLEERAWPVIREAARYYASLVVREKDGAYYSPCSQAYEGSPLFEEVITDTAMIRALMPVAAECAALAGCAGPESEAWKDIAANMNGFHIRPLDEDEYETAPDGRRILRSGVGKGRQVLGGNVFTVGKYLGLEGEGEEGFNYDALPEYITKPLEGVRKGDRLRNRHGNPDRPMYYGIPDPEFAPVFPAGIIGLGDRGSELYNASVDQVRLHPPAKPPQSPGEGGMAGGGSLCMGWCPYPIVLARLGLAGEAAQAVEHSVEAWQFYCQGFGHYGPYDVFTKDRERRWHTNTVTDHKTGQRFPSPSWPFRHFTFEAVPIVCAALGEMLLQSHEGFLRLLPATPSGWSGSFKLAAEGGFIVHAQYQNGIVRWAAVESRLENRCRIVNPWDPAPAYVAVLNERGQTADHAVLSSRREGPDAMIEFVTRPGMLYLLSDEPDVLGGWTVEPEFYEPNREMKSMGSARLGLPRMY